MDKIVKRPPRRGWASVMTPAEFRVQMLRSLVQLRFPGRLNRQNLRRVPKRGA
jgi:hypothetical protein